jgi:PilZ domain
MYCYVELTSTRLKVVVSASKSTAINAETENGLSPGKFVHLAIPVRWSLIAPETRGSIELACTYDIHPRGARLIGVREVKIGDLIQVERGRNRALCQVVWTADRNSPLRGQFSVQCVEGRTPWEDELKQAEEEYTPFLLDLGKNKPLRRAGDNRRRGPRYSVSGKADLIDGPQRMEALVDQLSEFGARLATKETLQPGTDFRLMLSVLDVNVGLKAKVKYLVNNLGMGVEFQEIRRGDRPLLDYVLRRLGARRMEEFVKVDVVREPLAAAAG